MDILKSASDRYKNNYKAGFKNGFRKGFIFAAIIFLVIIAAGLVAMNIFSIYEHVK